MGVSFVRRWQGDSPRAQLSIDANGNLVGTFTVDDPPPDTEERLKEIDTVPVSYIDPDEKQVDVTLPPATDTEAPTVDEGRLFPLNAAADA